MLGTSRGSASFLSLCEKRIGTKGSIRKLGEDDVKMHLAGARENRPFHLEP